MVYVCNGCHSELYIYSDNPYIFIEILFPKFCLSWSLLTFSWDSVRTAFPSMKLRCHYLTLLVFVYYRSLLNKCASPLILLLTVDPLTPLVTRLHTPWQAIAPLPKNSSIVVLTGQTFGDFVYINGRVVLKSVLQLYMDLLWMWIFWSLNYYCNNDNNYCHFCWLIPLMQLMTMPFFSFGIHRNLYFSGG